MVTKGLTLDSQVNQVDEVALRQNDAAGQSMQAPKATIRANTVKTVLSTEHDEELVKKIDESLQKGDRVVLLVFGKRLNMDGSLDGRGKEVIKEVAHLYEEIERTSGSDIKNLAVLLTGGKNSGYLFKDIKLPSESSVMLKALEAEGVKPLNVLLEQKSYDTVSNVFYSYPIVKDFRATTVVVVAEEFMAERALKIASEVFDMTDSIYVKPVKVELSHTKKIFERIREWIAIKALPLFFIAARNGLYKILDKTSEANTIITRNDA